VGVLILSSLEMDNQVAHIFSKFEGMYRVFSSILLWQSLGMGKTNLVDGVQL